MSRDESTAEVGYRLKNEAECRRIAELIKKELSPGLGFVLVTATLGEAGPGKFSNTSYVASIEREDSARLLTELLDYWQPSGIVCEPTVSTATKLREVVFDARKFTPLDLYKGVKLCVKELDKAFDKQSFGTAMSAAFVLSATALAIMDSFQQFRAETERKKRGD